MDRITICEKCGGVFIGNFCPVCGQISRIQVRVEVAKSFALDLIEKLDGEVDIFPRKKK